MQRLLADKRLQATSGFWLREDGGRTTQMDLAVPWQPFLSVFASEMRMLGSVFDLPSDWWEPYRRFPVRHIAFGADASEEPTATLYFSGPVRSWPTSMTELHESVRQGATAEHRAAEEQIFSGLALSTAHGRPRA